MLCKRCGNKTEFTMLKEVECWNDKEKKFEVVTDSDAYFVCDVCMRNNEEGKYIDTEGDY